MRVRTGSITLPTSSTLGAYLRVKMSGGYLALAGATDNEIGTMEDAVLTSGDPGAVVLKNVEGTIRMVAAGPITQYASVYGAANGCVDDVANANFIGMALTAATAAGDYVEVLRQTKADELDQLGAIDGNLVIDDDFIGDYPAAGTPLDNAQPWIKVETNGLGVTESAESDGVLMFAADAVEEAATAALYMPAMPFDIDSNPVFECRLAIFDIGDAAAVDINVGLSNGTHATDFDTVTKYIAFHFDGTDLSAKVRSKATATLSDTDTLVDLVDDTYANLRIDCTDKTAPTFWINDVQVAASADADLTGWTGQCTPIVHVEKTSDDTTFDVRVDRIRVQATRSNAA